jgi:hypothetical protein
MIRILKLALALAAMMFSQAYAQGAFNKTLTLQGVNFHVTCANEGSQNTLRIVPSGAVHNVRNIEQEIDGSVIGAEVADLDGNGTITLAEVVGARPLVGTNIRTWAEPTAVGSSTKLGGLDPSTLAFAMLGSDEGDSEDKPLRWKP